MNDPRPDSQPTGPSTEVMVERDLVYAVHDDVQLRADYYAPAGSGPYPALLLIHGGAWQGGSKDGWVNWGNYLAERGYVVFAISYRLSRPDFPTYPQNIWDCKAAVQYLRGQAAELKVDPQRIGALGGSAGGHLTAMLALTASSSKFANPYDGDRYRDVSPAIKVAVPVYGVLDLLKQWEHDQLARSNDQFTEKYIGGTPMDAREKYYEASPLYHASVQNARGTAWMIVWGTMDDVVDPQQAAVFAEHLKRTNAPVRPVPIVGAPHFWINRGPVDEPTSHNAYLAPRLLAFLREFL